MTLRIERARETHVKHIHSEVNGRRLAGFVLLACAACACIDTVCVREREKERKIERDTHKKRER
jgi:hypothetical protein